MARSVPPTSCEEQSTRSEKPTRFSDEDLTRYRQLLEDELQRLQEQRRRIEARMARNGPLISGAESQYDDHMADIATDAEDREIDLASTDHVDKLIAQIHIALEKIRGGSYGACDVCGDSIPDERLQVLPYATLCVQCQSLMESA